MPVLHIPSSVRGHIESSILMKNFRKYYLLIVLCISFHAEGQVVYDTIPNDTIFIGGLYPDKMMVFRDSSSLIYKNCQIESLPANYQRNGSVIIETTFGKNGILIDTKVVRGINPIYDSIAFDRIQSINDWMPGMLRGRFVNIPVTLPVQFENGAIVNSTRLISAYGSFISEEEYFIRKKIFDFLNSEEPNQPITSNDYIFKYFLSNYFKKNGNAFVHKYSLPNIFKSVYVKTNLNSKEDILYIISENYSYSIEENKHPKNFMLEKDKNFILIAYKRIKGNQPQISIMPIDASKRFIIEFEFKDYSKTQLIKEIEKYAP